MFKRLILYPFLFALYVVLIPLATNIEQVDPALALRPLAVLLLATVACLLLFYALFKDWQYSGYLVFLVLLFFFAFTHLNRIAQEQLSLGNENLAEPLFLLAWGVLLGILSLRVVWSRLGGRTWMLPLLNLILVMALIYPGAYILTRMEFVPRSSLAFSGNFNPDPEDVRLDCSARPDIYYLVLDGYGRADVLKSIYSLDNQGFLDYLERKGFYVARGSQSNYSQTVFSIPSSLNFAYIEPPPARMNGQEYFTNLFIGNRVMSILKRCGYRTVAFETGFSFTNHPDVDVFLSEDNGPNEFESLLLADSPIEVIAGELDQEAPVDGYLAHRRRVLYSFEKLAELYNLPGPKIVFAHIISPHPPFVFNARGQPIQPDRRYSIGDGEDFRGTLDEYWEGYAGQVQFVNQKLEAVINSLLENSSSPPVIILQGDHGPGSQLDWDSYERTCLWERTSILNAYYLPNSTENLLYPSISPVNSFRVVLNTYFGADLPLLPDRTYFTSHRIENRAIDITAKRTSLKNCNLAEPDK